MTLKELGKYLKIRREKLDGRLPSGSFIPLLDKEDGKERGVIVVHGDSTRDILLREILSHPSPGVGPHGGTISPYFTDQLVSTSSVLNSALQSRQLLQVVGSPQILAGLKDGSLSVMRSAGQMTGNAINTSTHKLAGQLRFAPANMGRIVGPLAVWQIINAAAGVTHLQKINAKLDALQREMERLTIRLQAKTYGQIVAAIEILQDLSNQHAIIGTFSSDMTMRLAVAEHAIRTSFAEQRLLKQRFHNQAKRVVEGAKKKAGAYEINTILKEETSEFFADAKLLAVSSQASLLVAEARIRHDLEHCPQYVADRLQNLERERIVSEAYKTVSSLEILEELHEKAKECLNDLNWFSKKIWNRKLRKEVATYELPTEETSGESTWDTIQETKAPSFLVWKDDRHQTRSVLIDAEIEMNT